MTILCRLRLAAAFWLLLLAGKLIPDGDHAVTIGQRRFKAKCTTEYERCAERKGAA